MTTQNKIIIAGSFILLMIAFLTRNKWLPVMKNIFGKKITCQNRFLFIGDSLTEFNSSYADQFKNVCPGLNYKKISKVGEKTDWMLAKASEELKNKYDVVSVWGGLNDIYATGLIEDAKRNLSRLYSMAKQSGAKVVAVTVVPTRTYTASDEIKIQLTNELNKWIKSNKYIDYLIDANGILNDGNDGTQKQYLQNDTLHLTSIGQHQIMQEFKNKIMK